jgi:hypothetical protein
MNPEIKKPVTIAIDTIKIFFACLDLMKSFITDRIYFALVFIERFP